MKTGTVNVGTEGGYFRNDSNETRAVTGEGLGGACGSVDMNNVQKYVGALDADRALAVAGFSVKREIETNHHTQTQPIIIRSNTMKKYNSLIGHGFIAVALTMLVLSISYSQGVIKNSGTFINSTGQTVSCKGFLNAREAVNAGTLKNAGTINVNISRGFYNYDSTSGSPTKFGLVHNYIGTTSGTINATGVVNNGTSGNFDNDSLNGVVGVVKVTLGLTATGTFDTDSGKVEFAGASQTVPAVTNGYGALVVSGTGATLAGSTSAHDTLRVATGGALTVGNTQTLTLYGTNNTAAGTFTAGNGSTVNYAGNVDQTIIPVSYATLTTSGATGAHTKTLASGVVITTALNIGSNDTLAVTNGTLDLGTNNASLTNTPANASALKLGGTGTVTFGAAVTNAGNVVYAGAAQTIAAMTYNDLYYRGTAAKTLGGNVNVNGNFVVTNSGSNVYGTSTFAFTGSSAQSISVPNEPFYTLQFSNGGSSAVKTVSGTFSANSVALTAGAYVSSSATMTIAAGGLTVNTATELTNSGSIGITGGDLVNDGSLTNSGSITVN